MFATINRLWQKYLLKNEIPSVRALGDKRSPCDSPADAEQTREELRLLKCIGAAQGTAKPQRQPQPKAFQPRVCDGSDRPRSQPASKESQSINHSIFSAVPALLYTLSIPKALLKAHYQTRSVHKVGPRVFESSLSGETFA